METQVQNTTPKITVILPVYNVADYLPRCLESIDNQTFRDFCVIAVNDGATDNSPEILREFEKTHPYFKVVDQENGGLSAARNKGLSLAESEYISFIDSDDFVEPDYLEKLYHACADNDADIACCYFKYYYGEMDLFVPHPFKCPGIYDRDGAMKKLFQDLQLQSFAWNKLYKRSLFADNNITYPLGMAFEDLATTPKLFMQAKKVVVIKDALYNYFQRKNSILKTPSPKMINDFIRAAAGVRVCLEQNGEFAKFKKYFNALCFKTHFYSNYYLTKIHVLNHSAKDYGKHLWQVYLHLNFYKGKRFHAEKLFDKNVDILPGALPAIEMRERKNRRA